LFGLGLLPLGPCLTPSYLRLGRAFLHPRWMLADNRNSHISK
jgi:hypothetical protein